MEIKLRKKLLSLVVAGVLLVPTVGSAKTNQEVMVNEKASSGCDVTVSHFVRVQSFFNHYAMDNNNYKYSFEVTNRTSNPLIGLTVTIKLGKTTKSFTASKVTKDQVFHVELDKILEEDDFDDIGVLEISVSIKTKDNEYSYSKEDYVCRTIMVNEDGNTYYYVPAQSNYYVDEECTTLKDETNTKNR